MDAKSAEFGYGASDIKTFAEDFCDREYLVEKVIFSCPQHPNITLTKRNKIICP